MKHSFCLAAAALVAAGTAMAREISDFCDGWEFSKDSKTWRAVEIPHDWGVEGPFEPEGDPSTGKLPWKGVGWYRKSIVMPEAPNGRRVFLDFDGIMCDGTVFVNSQPCARQKYGYLGLRADLTPYLFAGTNTVVVKADTTKLFSRWYPGAGMYRRVRKVETGDLYIDDSRVFVATLAPKDGTWTVRVFGSVVDRGGGALCRRSFCPESFRAPPPARVKVVVTSPKGKVVANVSSRAGESGAFTVDLPVCNPELWDMQPNAPLYTVEVSAASADGKYKDSVSVKTGFRTFKFDPDGGFFLNGRRVQLKGACLHSDLGILGMAFNRSAMRRELDALVDMGVNAIRTSHNPPSPELLELCDEMGLFVWDECFDKWNATCGRGDDPLEQFVEERLREFVRRDRNHPCVFVWSIGNEITPGKACPPGQEHWAGSPAHGTSAERCARFRDVVRSLDLTRPVGIASCFRDAVKKGDYAPLDITGWNYGAQYAAMHSQYPEKPVVYTESASALSEYGHYSETLPKDKADYDLKAVRVDSYDRNASKWSDIADREFERMERDTYVAGEFVWTGVDYLGEPTPYEGYSAKAIAKRDLARSAYFGIFDLLVLPKDRVWLYRAHWNKDKFTLHVVPEHWTFPEREGKSMPVYVYTSADEAELFLNGVSLGRRRKDPKAVSSNADYYGILPRYRLMWDDVKYAPGELKAVAYGADGKALGETVVRTAGEPAKVVLRADKATLSADPKDYVFVEVGLVDAKGTPVMRDNRRVKFAVEGPGKIVSVGNSDPRGLESFKAVESHPLYNGRAGLFIRSAGEGKVRLVATADGVKEAGEVVFAVEKPQRQQAKAEGDELDASACGGGRTAFMRRVAEKAAALDMKTAYFENPSGLTWNSRASASDLLKLGMACAHHPVFSNIWSKTTAKIEVKGPHARTITLRHNYSDLAGWKAFTDKYPFLGGKGGSLSSSGKSVRAHVIVTAIKGRRFVFAISGMKSSKDDPFALDLEIAATIEAALRGEKAPATPLLDAHVAIGGGYAWSSFDGSMSHAGGNAESLHIPASTTKMITALCALDAAAGSTAPVVICQADITGGSGFQCYPGDEFTLEDALTAMILPSANTLAETLSRH